MKTLFTTALFVIVGTVLFSSASLEAKCHRGSGFSVNFGNGFAAPVCAPRPVYYGPRPVVYPAYYYSPYACAPVCAPVYVCPQPCYAPSTSISWSFFR